MAISETITTPLSRRALFAGAGAASVVAAVPALASPVGSRTAWERAKKRLATAKATADAYYDRYCTPADNAFAAGRRSVPVFTLDDGQGEPTRWEAGMILHFTQPEYADNNSPLAVFARKHRPAVDDVMTHNRALAERLQIDRHEREFDRLVNIQCAARDVLFALPAPDLDAVLLKLRLLAEHDHLAGETGDDDPLPRITADVARLATH